MHTRGHKSKISTESNILIENVPLGSYNDICFSGPLDATWISRFKLTEAMEFLSGKWMHNFFVLLVFLVKLMAFFQSYLEIFAPEAHERGL